MPDEPDDLLSPDAAAEYLATKGVKVTGQTLRRWAKGRHVRHIALPLGLVKFHRDDLDELVIPIEPDDDTAAVG